MADKISPLLLIASGMQEIGKSYTSLSQMIYQAYIAQHKIRGLVFDTNAEYGDYVISGKTHNIKILPHNEIIKFGNQPNVEVRRVIPFHTNGAPFSPEETEKLLIQVITQFRHGELMIEDLNTIYGDALPKSVSGLLCNVRHRNAHVVFHLQSCSRLLPKMLQNAKIVRYHYQLDAVSASADKLEGDLEIFSIAEKLVNKQFDAGNKYFFVYIYRVIKKIKGQFSPRMFADAIQEYVSENPRILRALIDKRDGTGKKVNTYESALNQKIVELHRKYYGN